MQENSLIKKNILKFIDYKGITRYKFYQKTGITRGILDQNNGMSEENTARFLACYPEVATDWLLTGNGEMLRGNDKQITAIHTQSQQEGIPLIPINAMAGFAAGEISVLEYECERYVVPMFLEAEFLIPVKGSSMQPKYNSGDLVACTKLSLKDIFFQWNKVYVLDTEQGALIKRICKGGDAEHIKLVSDNEKYEPFELHLSQVNAVALVVGVMRLE